MYDVQSNNIQSQIPFSIIHNFVPAEILIILLTDIRYTTFASSDFLP